MKKDSRNLGKSEHRIKCTTILCCCTCVRFCVKLRFTIANKYNDAKEEDEEEEKKMKRKEEGK